MCYTSARKGKGRGGGRGSGSRGVRGVDFGLGIGYSPESNSSPSNMVSSQSATVYSLRTGMMTQLRSYLLLLHRTLKTKASVTIKSCQLRDQYFLALYLADQLMGISELLRVLQHPAHSEY